MRKILFILSSVLLFNAVTFLEADDKKQDKGKFEVYENEYWEKIKEESLEFRKEKDEENKKFLLDLSDYDLPKSTNEFKFASHIDPINQGWTGTCWCFSTTSFLEAEHKRLYGELIDISELYTVYWEYVEKARRFIRERGDSHLGEGSEANAVMRIMNQYGAVPAEAYSGKQTGQLHHDHSQMFNEINDYLKGVKGRNEWNEEVALGTVMSILDHYIGAPPENFKYNGKIMTPKEFHKSVLKLEMDNYVDILSLKEKPYWQQVVYPAPDNWWLADNYFNVPLDIFMESLKEAAKEGYTMMIGGDVSEPGYNSAYEVAVVPTFDIPAEYINEESRQFRWSNGTTTDDHAIHLVGYKEDVDNWWFLIKDSGSGAQNGPNKGYYFYHEDYVKLKMMNFLVHKDAVADLLKKFSPKQTRK